MTTESLPGEVGVDEVLARCDRLLGEIGRRQHLFGWLRAPGAAADQWLPVDAYYPGNRVVVLCSHSVHESVYADLVASHGLRLLRAVPSELAESPSGPGAALERLIAGLGPVRRPSGAIRAAPVPHESPVAQALVSATRPAERRRAAARHAPAPARDDQFVAAGLVVGIALVAVLCVEIYVVFTQIALSAGHVVLAFGIALDACSRVLGTIAAHRAGEPGWVWPSVLVGSPVVAAFALFRRRGPVTVDPAPLAGLMSVLAIGVVAVALLATILGI